MRVHNVPMYIRQKYMWQLQVENKHYSVYMKMEFIAENNAMGHCLYVS